MRNAEATKERILEAALAEFSDHGIAGARVDRIAQAARCNKNLIYSVSLSSKWRYTVIFETPARAATASIVVPPNPLFRNTLLAARKIVRRFMSARCARREYGASTKDFSTSGLLANNDTVWYRLEQVMSD